MDADRRTLLAGALACSGASLLKVPAMAAGAKPFTAVDDGSALLVRDPGGASEVRYLYGALPAGEKGPAVPGTAYSHPVWTPGGEVVTDVAAPDHPHHRGVFCAWIDVAGDRKGDWWGWGARAPKDGRAIISRDAKILTAGASGAVLEARNAWRADGQDVLLETVRIRASQAKGHNILDYSYHFVPASDTPVVLAKNPFGGFCYRAKPRGQIVISGPSGAMDRQDSWQDSFERNWPVSPWYDFSTTDAAGKTAGAAVIEHPGNPASTWHIIRPAHMLNPCIVAAGPVQIAPKVGITLRYRVAAHDGPVDPTALDALHAEFARG